MGTPDADDVLQNLLSALEFFCTGPLSPEEVIRLFAPGAITAGGVQLPPGQPYVMRNEAVTSLKLYSPLDSVIWWKNPGTKFSPAADIAEVHVALGPTMRIVLFENFVSAAGLGVCVGQKQNGQLSDILMEYKKGNARVVANRIVWSGSFVGKLGEFAVFKEPNPAKS